MSKSQRSNREPKKQSTLTAKERKAAKRDKKKASGNVPFIVKDSQDYLAISVCYEDSCADSVRITQRALTELISEAGILINGTFQDANNPIDFVLEEEKSCLKPGCLIIDVSCDERMGFYFVKPTSFKKPMFQVEKVDYYAVDHTPSYFWESASRSISAALIVHLPTIIAGPDDWQKNETIRRAVNIDKGVIQKADILAFQNRHLHYPHAAI